MTTRRRAVREGRRSTPLERELAARQSGRQGPASDPDRDGCGPLILLVLVGLLSLLVVLVGAL